ncbi:thiamine phosphate synthase [Vulgatibacter incomptus]|uniref:Thiamine-phosphate synthase n=1 Tax=Vulgatibacter incomptus TaxID=1391653 RepID=A0A0K1PEH8_9BACT|nr:thiamine phosphate synthase [Vulgatibacter incomptus]AKU91938.1 Thiamin-phosphate pyrophosphorylase [Vulgatibacter incomptus]
MRIHGLYAIADPSVRPDVPLPELCARLARSGASVVQIRWKGAGARELLEAARAALPLVRGAGAALVINDRPDIAWLAGADGVHLGADDLPIAEARKLVGPALSIGATVRDLGGAIAAAAAGADHVGFGPVFVTSTKVVDAPPRGLEGLRAICASSPVPVVAIAGIGLSNIGQVADCGASAAAVVSDLLRAESIEARGRALREAFEAGAGRRDRQPA